MECSNGIRDQGLKGRLCLGGHEVSSWDFHWITGSDHPLWRVFAPLWNERKGIKSTTLDWGWWWYIWTACILSGSHLGRADLRREQVESNHHENWATRREVRLITDITSTALGKEETVVCL
jgi:hypothetical protein